ncbi:MAG: VWA domain-containing protein [Halobacteriales archaeon]
MTGTDSGPRAGEDGVEAALSDIVDAREDVIESVVRFARALRRAGVAVPADGVLVAAEAIAEVGLSKKTRVNAATKASMLSRERDVETFEELFDQFWQELETAGTEPPDEFNRPADAAGAFGTNTLEGGADETRLEEGTNDDADSDNHPYETQSTRLGGGLSEDAGIDGEAIEVARYSPGGESKTVERTAGAGVGSYGLERAVTRLTGAVATLPGRRRKRTRDGRHVDARRALRDSFGTGGIVASLPESERADSAVRGTVLVDVSQSVLDRVDRGFLLEWLRLLAAEWRSLRVFFFDTVMREVTDAFDERTVVDVSEALARAEAAWGGGTQIGGAFETVRRSHPDAVDRRTVVLVVSDGVERGEVDDLERGAAWLSRQGRLLLWLNPLAASPSYEPVARGIAAALPAVDGLFAFAGADDVAELARQLNRHDRTRLGYEYDPRLADRRESDGDSVSEPDRAGTDSIVETVRDDT